MQTKNRCCLLDRCNAVSEIFGCNGFKVELVIGREFPENFQIDLFCWARAKNSAGDGLLYVTKI